MKLPTLDQFLDQIRARDPNQPEFMQAVNEVMHSLWPFIERNPGYAKHGLLERLVEPERAIQFRISWVDDQGKVRSEEHTSELQSLMRISYAVFCLKKKNIKKNNTIQHRRQHNDNHIEHINKQNNIYN